MRKLLLVALPLFVACASPEEPALGVASEELDEAAHSCHGAFIIGAWDGLPGDESASVNVAAEMIASADPSFTTINPLNDAPVLHVPGVVRAVDGTRRNPGSVPNDPQLYLGQWTTLERDPATGYDVLSVLGIDVPHGSGALNGAYARKLFDAMTRADQRSTTDHGLQIITRSSPKGAISCEKRLYETGYSYHCRIGMVAKLQPWSGCP